MLFSLVGFNRNLSLLGMFSRGRKTKWKTKVSAKDANGRHELASICLGICVFSLLVSIGICHYWNLGNFSGGLSKWRLGFLAILLSK